MNTGRHADGYTLTILRRAWKDTVASFSAKLFVLVEFLISTGVTIIVLGRFGSADSVADFIAERWVAFPISAGIVFLIHALWNLGLAPRREFNEQQERLRELNTAASESPSVELSEKWENNRDRVTVFATLSNQGRHSCEVSAQLNHTELLSGTVPEKKTYARQKAPLRGLPLLLETDPRRGHVASDMRTIQPNDKLTFIVLRADRDAPHFKIFHTRREQRFSQDGQSSIWNDTPSGTINQQGRIRVSLVFRVGDFEPIETSFVITKRDRTQTISD